MNHVLNRFAGGLLWLTLLVGLSGSGSAQLITTVAGTDTAGFYGDGGAATESLLGHPIGVAVDGAGNLFIADQNGHRIWRVAFSTGLITTVAGTGTAGFSGDGSAATAAGLNSPIGVAVDGAGNLFIADSYNHRIRRVAFSTGLVTTVAGTGTEGFSGDGGAATAAGLNTPTGVAVDGGGNLFIADQYDHRVRRVAASTGLITTVAGTGTGGFSGDGGAATAAGLSYPSGVAVDGAGNLFIADQGNNRIRRVAASTGLITTVAGTDTDTVSFNGDGGAATAARLNSPSGVAVDGAGNLFIAEQSNNRIRRVAFSTGLITTVAGTGTKGFSGDGGAATLAWLNDPTGVAVDRAGNLFIADPFSHRIRRVAAATGLITTVAGTGTEGFSGDGGAAIAARLNKPTGVAVDGAGNLFIADQVNDRIRRVAASTGLITTMAGTDTVSFSGDGGAATAAGLSGPTGVAVDGAGNLFIADRGNNRIRRVAASTGLITTVAGTNTDTDTVSFSGDGGAATAALLSGPTGVAVDRAGNLFIADTYNNRIRRVAFSTGLITTVAGTDTAGFYGDGGAATAAWLYNPTGVAVDGAGNLFIADTYNNRIRRVAFSTGLITTVAGTDTDTSGFSGEGGAATQARLYFPSGVAVDGAGNLFIADQGNNRIRRVAASTGLITTVAGSDTVSFSGDGGAATQVRLNNPTGVAVDGAGNLFIADSDNHRIRRVASYSRPFAITGVTTIRCETVNVGERRLTFTPQYSGLTGQPVTFRVLNELEPTTQPGPYTLRVYTDNPTINLRATQPGTAGEASFVYNWLGACNAGGRRATAEAGSGLRVAVLGNPVGGKTVEVEISGVGGQSVAVTLRNLQGRLLNQQTIERASTTNRVAVPVETGQGMLLLEVSTATERQQIKLLRP